MKRPKKIIDPEVIREHLNYDPETGVFTTKVATARRPTGTTFGAKYPGDYVRITVLGVQYAAHRLAWVYVYGEQPDEVDHRNRIKDDNRIANLRNCTHQENCLNVVRFCKTTKRAIHHGVKHDRENRRS